VGRISQWWHRLFVQLKQGSQSRGQQAEYLAERYLKRQGLLLIERNYQTKGGEIDLIMRDKSVLVFVEVRYKSSSDWASPVESITLNKQQKIIKAAKQYLQQHDKHGKQSCRFDVVAMAGELNDPQIEWLPHAFY